MAKKRKKEKKEEEEYEFKAPEFDEKEFLTKELRDTKTVLITVGYAAFFGCLAGALANIDEGLAVLGFALLLAGVFSLKYFYPLVKIDISVFQKKNWAGNIGWFFMTFLAVWILVINYPFADHTDPSVGDLTVWVDNTITGNITAMDYELSPAGSYVWSERWGAPVGSIIVASESYVINITAKVADNGELSTVRIQVNGAEYVMSPEGDHRYGYSFTGDQITSSGLMFTITATDSAGHVKSLTPAVAIPVTL